ncbi:hypothetical protein [Actinoplanes sp. N902-109]|uniref:hypothetical protein n=1 Tax=Actinoplanes sp. (strain N902-109) TaxID=649831 RepID=UPI0003A943CE|nr:hypothetical protein [Actinoplanes sp. N902-109]
MTLEAPVTAPPGDGPGRARPRLDVLVKIGGIVVSVLATALTAGLELLLTPLRIGAVPIGVAVLVAIVANWAIAWFATAVVGRRWAIAPPWAVWTLIMFVAAGTSTPEGDYLVSGNDWIALVMILVGSLTFAVYTYRAILKRSVAAKP